MLTTIIHIRCVQRRRLKACRRRNHYVIMHHIRNSKKKTFKSSVKRPYKKNYNPIQTFTLPAHFSLNKNVEEVIRFVNRTYKKCVHSSYRTVSFQMQNVVDIDQGSICLFLSLINKISALKKKYFGTYPSDPQASKIFKESGFLEAIRSVSRRKQLGRDFDNQIYIVGNQEVLPMLLGSSVKKTIEFLTGNENHFLPLYSCLVELSTNAVEHANQSKKDKNWLLSISYDIIKGERAVRFIMADAGLGILGTLYRKQNEIIIDKLSFKSSAKILEDLFNEQYQSCTLEPNRHQGLPKIKKTFDNGYINDLKVITNNVIYNFDDATGEKLANEYRGACYMWTIKKTNYEIWKKQLM